MSLPYSTGFDYGPNSTVMESFSWIAPNFKIEKESDKSIILKVKAGKAGSVSLNGRKYLDEEFIRAARTATGKKVDINHSKQQIGKIHLGDYEDSELEMVVEIWKEPYVTLLRNKSLEVKGWSIDANYLFAECVKCHKKFQSEEEYKKHMVEEEFIRDGVTVPRGIVFNEYALSLVTTPEHPGLETSYTLMETHKGFNELIETVLKEHGIAIAQGENKYFVGKSTAQPKEQPKAEPQKPREPSREEQIKKHFTLLETAPEPYRSSWRYLLSMMDQNVAESKKRAEELEKKAGIREIIQERDKLIETNNQQSKKIQQLEEEVRKRDNLVQENNKLIEMNNGLKIENDNLKDKLKPQFRAHSPSITRQSNPDFSYRPGSQRQ